ncbi:hypothetical protein BN7874_190 [Phage NCTB]|nr:hypothetical protein BN7874_190 [Phage NCTB]
MLTFKTGPSLAKSALEIMGSSDSFSDTRKVFACYLFSGPVPNSLDEVPFSVQNPFDISRNCVAMSFAAMYQKTGEDANILEGDHSLNAVPVKRSAMDVRRGRYRLAPEYLARYDLSPEFLNEFPSSDPASSTYYGLFPDQSPGELDYSGINSYRWQMHFGDLACWYNERYSGTPGNLGRDWTNYGSLYSGRYALSNDQGVFMEFDQDVTVDALEIYQYSNTSYTSAQWALEYYDEETSSWVQHYINDTSEINFNADKEFFVEIPPITAKKFILSGVNTGNSYNYIRHVSLLSTLEPYNTAPLDITWALVLPAPINLRESIFARANTESHSEVGKLPVMLCSVGDALDQDHLLVLSKSTGLPGYFFPRILNINFEFIEPEVSV